MLNSRLRGIPATAFLASCLFSGTALAAKDIKGSADHPLVSRYEGAGIVQYSQEKFDEYTVLLGKAKGREPGDHQVVEGRVTKIRYEIDKERTTLEGVKN